MYTIHAENSSHNTTEGMSVRAITLLFFFITSVFVLFLSTSANVHAQQSYQIEDVPGGGEVLGDFMVGPGKVDLTIAPGESRVVEMTVTNRTGERRRFNITTEDASGSQNIDTAIVLLGDERGPYSLKDYIAVPFPSFELDHNQRARIPVTISVPLNGEPGGLYGSVLVDTVALEAQSDDVTNTVPQSAIVARIGTLFFITIPGAIEYDASLSEFATAPRQRFHQAGPINFGILHENNGSVHIAPYGELHIRNMFGTEVGYSELDPWFILPQSVRLREVSWGREYLFGRYTATVLINRGYDDVVDEMSYTFWVLPWKPIAVTFVTLFLIFFGIQFFSRRFKRKEAIHTTGSNV